MIEFPKPVLQEIDKVIVVRDDLLPGGTKRRALPVLLKQGREFVYGSPTYGMAQLALALACKDIGATCTLFVPQRKDLHPRTLAAQANGATVIQVPNGMQNVVDARARCYAQDRNAILLPMGFDTPEFIEALANVAKSLPVTPAQVWCIAASGTLAKALHLAWSDASFHLIQTGRNAKLDFGQVYLAPERYEQDAKNPPPFPSCSNVDAKAWQFVSAQASPGALFWNVAG